MIKKVISHHFSMTPSITTFSLGESEWSSLVQSSQLLCAGLARREREPERDCWKNLTMKMIDLYYFIHNTCYYQWISVICKYFSQNSVLFSLFLLTHRIRKNCIHNLMAIADSSFTALLLVTLVCSVNTDCPLSYYPRQTTIGNVILMQAISEPILILLPPIKTYLKYINILW